MTVNGPWLNSAATQAVFDVYERNGCDVFAVGGCVRNALLSEPVSDIDMASAVPPDRATAFLEKAGFKVVPTGIDHGTITVVVKGTAFEITTFRKDIDTDGRRAVVAYATQIEDDAVRRDFTINALYVDRNGRVIDPVGGLEDIAHRTLRFIGDGAARIQEDYLRALRFFRFHAHFADPGQGFDTDALAAIAGNLDGLPTLSRERIRAELLKLLSARDPCPAVMTMAQVGVFTAILPGADATALGPLVHLEHEMGLPTDPIRRLAAIVTSDLAKTLRLSKSELRHFEQMRNAATGSATPSALGFTLKEEAALSALALRSAFFENPVNPRDVQDIKKGATAVFPLTAKDLPNTVQGKQIGETLRKFEADWIASDFTLTKSDLLG